jgi:dihydropyrimidinase
MTVQGVTDTVLSRGKVIIDQRKYVGTPGEGSFLKRSTFGWK